MEKTVCKVMEHSEAAKHLEIPFGIFSRKNFFKNQGTTNEKIILRYCYLKDYVRVS